MKRKESRMHAVHIAYLNQAPFEDKVPLYADLKAAADAFIAANYAFQKALYGRVMVKLSTAKLLR